MSGENPPPTITATVSVVRAPSDWRGILSDLALRGESTVKVAQHPDHHPDSSYRYVQVPNQVGGTGSSGYTLSDIAALRQGNWRWRWGGVPPALGDQLSISS